MPSGNLTLVDLAARTGSDALIGLIEDVTTWSPEFREILTIPKAGITYKLTRRTALPPAAFRHVNDSATAGKSTYEQDTKSMYFLDCQLEMDEAIVKGDDRSIGSVLTDEAQGGLESTFNTLGSQFYYGTAADAKGFVGLSSQISDDSVYAGGTNNTTSAYLIDISEKGVHFVVGNDGQIAMPEWTRQKVAAGNFAYVTNISSYIGLNVGSAYSVYRVRGIGASNKLTDALGAKCLKNMPLRRRGSNLRWLMNRTAAWTLQDSRSSVGQVPANGGGGPAYADLPTELQGIPIILTDSLLDTETTVAA